MMLYTDKEIQDVSAGQGNRVRMALVESTSNIAEVDSRKNTTQNTQVQLWTLAFPVCAIIFIITVLLLNSLITPAGEVEESRANGPILLKASSSPKPSANKHSGQIFVSSIAYSDTSAIAFVNDQK